MRALSAIGFILFIQACFVSVDDFPVATSEVGDACDDSNPCPPGLDCWRADADPGAPGGVCTKTCVTPDDCPSGSNCVDIAGKRTCLPACEFGTGESSKCRGRRELGCNEQNSCVPLCSSDAHCPGRYCDRTQGLCVDARNGGSLAPGALCTNAAQCRGDCVPAAGSFKVCQEQCVLGSQGACASDGSDTNLG
ncbi:MAG TPA: hypothetical protein VFB62_08655, partial [Polyangiaceae bacterium]|nr:hypothetical protein [Polyangiaceae bacterium]